MGRVERPERFHARARFEGYELDLRAGELGREGGKTVRLSEQPFQILRLLLEHPGEVVTPGAWALGEVLSTKPGNRVK
jgi:DNA-binding response OmpR family regulator